ncbi:MAG TPA: prepilin peptidase [Clostridia bacterium]|nr:prepilin peptidase [Clostridia bacterium]
MESLFMASALAIGITGAFADIRTRRIPNALTYTGMIAGIAVHTVMQGWSGLASALLGGLIAGGIFLVFFLLRVMGGGDLKLMTAIGCFAGPQNSLRAVLATAIAGGVIAIGYAIFRGRLRKMFSNMGDLIRFHAVAGAAVHPTLNLSNPEAMRFPYGTAIAAGALYSFLATIA